MLSTQLFSPATLCVPFSSLPSTIVAPGALSFRLATVLPNPLPPEVKHWHGAKANSWFSHLAIECPGEETSNEWLEAVTEEQYAALKEDETK